MDRFEQFKEGVKEKILNSNNRDGYAIKYIWCYIYLLDTMYEKFCIFRDIPRVVLKENDTLKRIKSGETSLVKLESDIDFLRISMFTELIEDHLNGKFDIGINECINHMLLAYKSLKNSGMYNFLENLDQDTIDSSICLKDMQGSIQFFEDVLGTKMDSSICLNDMQDYKGSLEDIFKTKVEI